MLKAVRYLTGYIIYNVIFWVVFSALWLRKNAVLWLDKSIRKFRKGASKKDLYVSNAKKSLLKTYFGKNYARKKFNQELFTSASRKLKKLHGCCFNERGFEINEAENLYLKNRRRGNIFVGFHTVNARRRFLGLLKHFDIRKFGFVARERWQVTKPLRTYYGLDLSDDRKHFRVGGVKASIFLMDDPVEFHSSLVKFLKEGGWLFFSYDVPPPGLFPEDLRGEGKLDRPSKRFVYEFKGEKTLIVSTYLLHLLQRTGAKGIPTYARRLKNGKDQINVGVPISVKKDEKIGNTARDKFNRLFDFMSENIVDSGLGWFNSNTLARYLPHLRKPDSEIKERNWTREYFHNDFQLRSPVFLNVHSPEKYLITSSSPVQAAIIGPETKDIVSVFSNNLQPNRKLKQEFSRSKLEPVLAHLWEAGFIEKAGGD